eukprot:6089695-Ditylum_brightwellii.AAC.1
MEARRRGIKKCCKVYVSGITSHLDIKNIGVQGTLQLNGEQCATWLKQSMNLTYQDSQIPN